MKLLRKVEENFKTDSTPFLFWKNNNNLFVYIASLYYNVFLTYDDQNVLNLNNLKISYRVIDDFTQEEGAGSLAKISYRANVQQVYQTSMTTARGNIKWDFVNPTPQALPAQLSIST